MSGRARVRYAGGLLTHPGPAEGELVHLGRFDDREEIVEDRVRFEVDRVLHEPLLTQQLVHGCRIPLERQPQGVPDGLRQPSRQPVHRAEVQYPEAPPSRTGVHGIVQVALAVRRDGGGRGQQPEIARVRVRVQQSGASGPGEKEPGQQLPGPVPLFGSPVGDHIGQRHTVDPLGDQHLVGLVDHPGDHHIGIVRELLGVPALRLRLLLVVQLLGHPVAQLLDQRLDVHAGDQRAEQPGEPAELCEIREQRLTGARILHLHGHLPAVVPHRPVHLPDRGGCRGLVLEFQEQLPPLLAEPLRQYRVDRGARQGRGGLLQFGQGRPVGTCDLFRQGGLEDRQGLPQFHGPALQLAQHLEELIGGALLHFAGDQLRGLPADALAKAPRGTAGEPQRQRGQLGGSGDRLPGKIRHMPLQIPDCRAACGGYPAIVSCAVPAPEVRTPSVCPPAPQEQSMCAPIWSDRQSNSGSAASQRDPVLAGSSPSRKASAWDAASPATAVASARSHACTAVRRPDCH